MHSDQRRDSATKGLQNLTVPQFYPSTTTNSTAPRQFQFSATNISSSAGVATAFDKSNSMQLATGSHHKQQQMSTNCLIEEPEIIKEAKKTLQVSDPPSVLKTASNQGSTVQLSMAQQISGAQQEINSARRVSRQGQNLSRKSI